MKYSINGPGVYVIGTADPKAVKIGKSGNIEERLKAIQSNNHERLFVHSILDDDPEKETSYHERFSSLRIHGEWFKYEGELKKLIEKQTLEICNMRRDFYKNLNEIFADVPDKTIFIQCFTMYIKHIWKNIETLNVDETCMLMEIALLNEAIISSKYYIEKYPEVKTKNKLGWPVIKKILKYNEFDDEFINRLRQTTENDLEEGL